MALFKILKGDSSRISTDVTPFHDGMTADTDGVVGISQLISDAELEAVKSAELYVCGQGDGTLTIAAFGDVPTCDIPIVVILLH